MLHGEQYFGNLTALTSNQWRRDNNKTKNETLNRKYVTIFLLKGLMVLRVAVMERIKRMIFYMIYALSFMECFIFRIERILFRHSIVKKTIIIIQLLA